MAELAQVGSVADFDAARTADHRPAGEMMTVDEIKKALQEPLFDSLIVRHGFTSFLRDYDVVAYIKEHQFLYRFSHCTSAWITTAVADRFWQQSWDDIYTDYASWERAGSPEGYLWAVCYSAAYPGAAYVDNSELAREWSLKRWQADARSSDRNEQPQHRSNFSRPECTRIERKRRGMGEGTRPFAALRMRRLGWGV